MDGSPDAFKDKVVAITGASSGIGAAVAADLARRGARVTLIARRREAMEEVVARAGSEARDRMLVVVADVGRRDEVKRAVDETLARFGRIDVWINNAGRGITRAPSELSDADVEDMMRANVLSALYGMQEVLPHFRERGAGHIINVSSMLARMPWAPLRCAYSGAKHFLNALTANFRAEVQVTHPAIQVSLVSPGVVYTDFGLNALHGGPDSRQFPDGQTADEVARVIAGVIASPRADVYTRAGARQRVAEYYAGIGEDA